MLRVGRPKALTAARVPGLLALAFVLLDERGHRFLVASDDAVARVPGLGTVRTDRLAPSLGRRIEIGGRQLLVLSPSARDLRETMEHGPQTLTPKDLAALLYEADVRAGSRVVEGGSGSGALAVALARIVGDRGQIYSYDVSETSLAVARANARGGDVTAVVEFAVSDLRRGITQRDVDAVLLDLPDPWEAVAPAWEALRPCGHLATFSPNMEQVKETVSAIRRHPFIDVRTVELIEREMEVRDVGVRPSFAALGHTGYLTFARKVLETF